MASGTYYVFAVKDIAEMIDGLIENNFDCYVVIEGTTGIGKSTLAKKIINKCKNLNFDIHKNIYFSRTEAIKSIATKQKTIIWLDEMINLGYKRDFYETEQKELIKAIAMYRDNFNCIIACLPYFSSLDTDLKDSCKIRFTIIRRGFALVQTKIPTIYSTDRWDLKNNQKIEAKWSLTGQKPQYRKLTTVRGIIHYGALAPDEERVYKEVKHEKRYRVTYDKLNDNEKSLDETFYSNLVIKLKNREIDKEQFNQLCNLTNKKIQNVRTRVNQILQEQGSKDKVKELLKSNITNKETSTDVLGFKE